MNNTVFAEGFLFISQGPFFSDKLVLGGPLLLINKFQGDSVARLAHIMLDLA